MRNDAYETIDYKGCQIKIYQDENGSDSPRDWDNAGTMICFHRRYALGDVKESKRYNDGQDFIYSIAGIDPDAEEYEDMTGDEVWGIAMKAANEKNIILPLYLYDHSGITMSTSRGYPFNCPWDSGQVGWIYISHEQAKSEWPTEDWMERAVKYLEGEVEVYDQYLTGDVYGFQCFGLAPDITIESDDYDIEVGRKELDSCWGFYGTDWDKNGLFDHAKPSIDYYLRERVWHRKLYRRLEKLVKGVTKFLNHEIRIA